MCLWGSFQKRLAFELVDCLNQTSLSSMDGNHPIHWRPEWEKKKGWIHSCSLRGDICLLLPLDIGNPGSHAFGLRMTHTTGFTGSSACRQHIVGILGLHNCMSQYLRLCHCLCVCLFLSLSACIHTPHILLVLLPWRNLMNTPAYQPILLLLRTD